MSNIIQIEHGREEMVRIRFGVCVHCDLDLGDMTVSQGHSTPLDQEHQLCEILCRSIVIVRSYGPDTNFGYACSVTLTLGMRPWVMVNNYVKYYPCWTRS